MPRLGKTRFGFESQAQDEKLEWDAEVSVSTNGAFRVSLPECLYAIYADKNVREELARQREWRGAQPKAERTKSGKPCVVGDSLEDCKRLVGALGHEWARVSISTALVILYSYRVEAAYWKTESGELRVNGILGGAGEWKGGLRAGSGSSVYQVGVGAQVYTKQTFAGRVSQRCAYSHPGRIGEEAPTLGEWGSELNRYIGLSLINAENRLRDGQPAPGVQEMPYSEAAAKLFVLVLRSIVATADQLGAFFSDQATLLTAISRDAGQRLLERP